MEACIDTDSTNDTAEVLLSCGDNPAGAVSVVTGGPGVGLHGAVATCPTSFRD